MEIWPLEIKDPEKTVGKDSSIAPVLQAKLAQWLVLCEMFPFRISFLQGTQVDFKYQSITQIRLIPNFISQSMKGEENI